MNDVVPDSVFYFYDQLLDLCQADQEKYIDSLNDPEQRSVLRLMLGETLSSLSESILDRSLFSYVVINEDVLADQILTE